MAALDASQLTAYLQRIGAAHLAPRAPQQQGHQGPIPDLALLRAVHRAHTHSVPFENLTLHHPAPKATGERIVTDLPSVHNKLVSRRRGGYCFEHNTLLAAALRTLGYDLYTGSAKVVGPPPSEEKADMAATAPALQLGPRTHMMMFVRLAEDSSDEAANHDRRGTPSHAAGGGSSSSSSGRADAGAANWSGEAGVWLTDVGFGGRGLLEPIPLVACSAEEASAPVQEGQLYSHRLRRGFPQSAKVPSPEEGSAAPHRHGWYLQMAMPRGWEDLYFFTREESSPTDYACYNWYTSTHPDSLFVNKVFCSMPTEPAGRVTLLGSTLTIRHADGSKEEREVEGDADRDDILARHFGVRF